MTNFFPMGCLQEFQRLQRAFVWGDGEGVKKFHAVNWTTLQLLKYLGGLGTRNLPNMKWACLMKLGWTFKQEYSRLWVEIMKGKYGGRLLETGTWESKPTDSALWKNMAKLWPWFREFETWSIGNGRRISVWRDNWIGEWCKLIDMVEGIADEVDNW